MRPTRPMGERVVLAWSGDPAALRPLVDAGARVVAVAVDLGRGGARRAALDLGAVEAVVVDAREEFADRYCLPALRANALRPVSELVPPLVARHLVDAARRHGATAVAHDRTGDDRVRFETCVGSLAPDLEVVAPLRDDGPPVDVVRQPARPVEPGDPDELVIAFDRGRPVAIDGETVTMSQAVRELNRRSGALDRPVAEHVYEAAGAIALATAHRELEDAVLDPDLARFKRRVERRRADLVRAGLWFAPLRQSLDSFIDSTLRHVSGEVRLVLRGGRAVVTGRGSPSCASTGPTSPRGLPSKIAAK
ncbi:argininosuccinate synthase domain-containing protein [Saccharothrix sp. HUAS TT1]|uniref:argininosuccinate synthase domain-containing protein n=1 Tax=unclassified Saccharothrix TaxID=2593673 RepID=UPI00345B828C